MHLPLFPQDVCVHRTRDHVDQHEKYLLEKLTYLFLRLINTRLHIFVSSVNPLHTTWNLLFHLGDHSGFSLQHFLGGNGLASEMLELKGVFLPAGNTEGRGCHWNIFHDLSGVREAQGGRV